MSDTDPRIFPVTVNVSTDGDHVNISCDPEIVDVPKGLGCALITFTLKGPQGFSFSPTNAIVPNDQSNSDFPCASWTIGSTLAGLYDRNKHAAKVKYTVNLVDAQGKPYPYDPEIKNGGDAGTVCGDDVDC